MGLGKQKTKLDGELFRRTERQDAVRPKAEESQIISASDNLQSMEKIQKERFSLYLEPSLAKKLRLYAVENDIKNINGLLTGVIKQFLKNNGVVV